MSERDIVERLDDLFTTMKIALQKEGATESEVAEAKITTTAKEAAAEILRLRAELADMEARKDAAYLERNKVVAALATCFPSGTARTAIEGWSEDWHGCVYIDLPTGQVSWHYHDSHSDLFTHLPQYFGQWDGHDTEEKYRRVIALRSELADAKRAGWIAGRDAAAEWVENSDIDYAVSYAAGIRVMEPPA